MGAAMRYLALKMLYLAYVCGFVGVVLRQEILVVAAMSWILTVFTYNGAVRRTLTRSLAKHTLIPVEGVIDGVTGMKPGPIVAYMCTDAGCDYWCEPHEMSKPTKQRGLPGLIWAGDLNAAVEDRDRWRALTRQSQAEVDLLAIQVQEIQRHQQTARAFIQQVTEVGSDTASDHFQILRGITCACGDDGGRCWRSGCEG